MIGLHDLLLLEVARRLEQGSDVTAAGLDYFPVHGDVAAALTAAMSAQGGPTGDEE